MSIILHFYLVYKTLVNFVELYSFSWLITLKNIWNLTSKWWLRDGLTAPQLHDIRMIWIVIWTVRRQLSHPEVTYYVSFTITSFEIIVTY